MYALYILYKLVYGLLALASQNLRRCKGLTILRVPRELIGTTAVVVMMPLGIGLVESHKKQVAQSTDEQLVVTIKGYKRR